MADADAMEAKLPPEAHALYGGAIKALRVFADETAKRGIPAAEVAKAVAHALTAKKPKTRYIVGTDARMQAVLAKFVPDRLRDGLIARQLKLPKKA
jgi:hypothetical protein